MIFFIQSENHTAIYIPVILQLNKICYNQAKDGVIMNALVLVLNETKYLEDILNNLMTIGVKGATILESQGMGSAILTGNFASSNRFGALKTAFDRERPYNKTIFAIIEDEELLHLAIETIKEVSGGLSKPGEGLLFTIPVGNVLGMAPDKN